MLHLMHKKCFYQSMLPNLKCHQHRIWGKIKSLSEGITNLDRVIYVFPSIWLSSVTLLRLTTVTCSPIYSHFLLLQC